ncbi:MAG: hypothetical protein SGILL_004731 [Bacillariaceae sp.]
MMPFPQQELSLQVLNPFPESVFSYLFFLACFMLVWVLYLLLPRGFRKQYCNANRKRYTRRSDRGMPAAGYWLPVHSMQNQASSAAGASKVSLDQSSAGVHNRKPQQSQQQQPQYSGIPSTIKTRGDQTPISTGGLTSSPPRSMQQPDDSSGQQRRTYSNPPSPEHPALTKIPPNKIIAETMARLQGRGIRLVAHGVHCDPKRVWIRLQDNETKDNPMATPGEQPEEPCVTWQTEFPRRVPNQSGQVSIVLMRGSLHKIVLKNILYIDVGKKTQALQQTTGVPDATCLSLLTQNGSLDLQANSKLERDALVSCFSMILDDVHEEDWRALYEASPEPSLANSSTPYRDI